MPRISIIRKVTICGVARLYAIVRLSGAGLGYVRTIPCGVAGGVVSMPPGVKTKRSCEEATPVGEEIMMLPLGSAPVRGKNSVISFTLIRRNGIATPPINTDVTVPKFSPKTCNTVPTSPRVGVNEVISGADVISVNDVVLLTTPSGVVKPITPETPSGGTVSVTCVAPTICGVIATFTPPMLACVVPARFRPVIVMRVPGLPRAGETPVMAGNAGIPSVRAMPPCVITVTTSFGVTPAGIEAVSCAGLTMVKGTFVRPIFTFCVPVKFSPEMRKIKP